MHHGIYYIVGHSILSVKTPLAELSRVDTGNPNSANEFCPKHSPSCSHTVKYQVTGLSSFELNQVSTILKCPADALRLALSVTRPSE